jgi:hypothetical protein
LFAMAHDASHQMCYGKQKESIYRQTYAYESFVHPIKGLSKMGVKRSIRMIRSSQSCHPETCRTNTPKKSRFIGRPQSKDWGFLFRSGDGCPKNIAKQSIIVARFKIYV